IIVPGLPWAAVARGTELILRNSTFRSAYELLFNALPPQEKRAAKTVVDVTALRSGRIAGSGVIQAVVVTLPALAIPVLLGIVAALTATILTLSRQISEGHRRALSEHVSRRARISDAITLSELLVTGPISIQREALNDPASAAEALAEAVASRDVTA